MAKTRGGTGKGEICWEVAKESHGKKYPTLHPTVPLSKYPTVPLERVLVASAEPTRLTRSGEGKLEPGLAGDNENWCAKQYCRTAVVRTGKEGERYAERRCWYSVWQARCAEMGGEQSRAPEAQTP